MKEKRLSTTHCRGKKRLELLKKYPENKKHLSRKTRRGPGKHE